MAETRAVTAAEDRISVWQQYWNSTSWSRRLEFIVKQVIEDRNASPISNVACLAIGGSKSLPQDRTSVHDFLQEMQQFIVFSQIVAQLAAVNPRLLQNVVVQDPMMTHEWRVIFENRGFRVVSSPAAFDLIGPNTLLVAPFLPVVAWKILARHLVSKAKLREVRMFMGNGDSALDSAEGSHLMSRRGTLAHLYNSCSIILEILGRKIMQC